MQQLKVAKNQFQISGVSKKAKKRLSKSLTLYEKALKKAGYEGSELIWSQNSSNTNAPLSNQNLKSLKITGLDKLTGASFMQVIFYNTKGIVIEDSLLDSAPEGSDHEDLFSANKYQTRKGFDKFMKFNLRYIGSAKFYGDIENAIGENGIIDSTDVDRFAALSDSYPGIVPNDPFSTYIAIGDSNAFA